MKEHLTLGLHYSLHMVLKNPKLNASDLRKVTIRRLFSEFYQLIAHGKLENLIFGFAALLGVVINV
jgi:hypothetical protein